jgi:hypothetical protein
LYFFESFITFYFKSIGKYTCSISTAQSTAVLSIRTQPKILTDPAEVEVTVRAGSSHTLDVAFVTHPAASVAWVRDSATALQDFRKTRITTSLESIVDN